MGLVEQVHIFGLSNIHTSEPNISLNRVFSLIFNYAKSRFFQKRHGSMLTLEYRGPRFVLTCWEQADTQMLHCLFPERIKSGL